MVHAYTWTTDKLTIMGSRPSNFRTFKRSELGPKLGVRKYLQLKANQQHPLTGRFPPVKLIYRLLLKVLPVAATG